VSAHKSETRQSYSKPVHQPAVVGNKDASHAELRLILPETIDPEAVDRPQPITSGSGYSSRLLDVTLALGLIVFLFPVMLLIAMCIKITSKGPVIFAHRRIGKDGKEFNCLKFRTMHHGAEDSLKVLLARDADLRKEWQLTQKLLSDPRVTPLGRLLRNTSLDELPQLFCVLSGDMALVGPRPIVMAELSRYGHYASTYTSVRPGLTGLWQITRTENTSYRRRVATDVLYVRKRTFFLDCRILLATIPALLIGNGTTSC